MQATRGFRFIIDYVVRSLHLKLKTTNLTVHGGSECGSDKSQFNSCSNYANKIKVIKYTTLTAEQLYDQINKCIHEAAKRALEYKRTQKKSGSLKMVSPKKYYQIEKHTVQKAFTAGFLG